MDACIHMDIYAFDKQPIEIQKNNLSIVWAGGLGSTLNYHYGINTAKLDAEILMAKALKKDRKYIILNNNPLR